MEHDELNRALGRVEGKLDSAISIIGDLRAAFDQLEKRRLSRLEVQFATFSTEVATKARNWAALWAIAASVIASVVSAIIISQLLK